jgi:sterol desaturase/sphingolipid hydroxylase (fatty acid hydroxylase superfamily)
MILTLLTYGALAIIVTVLWYLQRKFPLEPGQSPTAILTDWKLCGLRFVSTLLIGPIAKASAILIVNAAGGGWIHLRSDGWWFLVSVLVVILVTDFWSYLLHRAEHQIPVLWAMHSLHHSAEALTIVTGARHFWLEGAINAGIFPVVGLILQIPPEVVTTVSAIYIVPDGLLSHVNIRMSFGRFALWVQNPQYHRIHHSLEPQHFNKNFCKLLPLFDVLFGTAWKPGKDEFPATGLAGEKATGFVDGFIWPLRHRLSWRASSPAVATDTRIFS